MRKFILLGLYSVIFNIGTYAETSNISANQAGYVIHMLNYLSNDYKNAVENGKVKSEDELKEMVGFAANIDKEIKQLKINQDQKDTLVKYSTTIIDLVNKHQDQAHLKEVSALAKQYLLQKTGLKCTPSNYPSISKGQTLFLENCANCHGEKGDGTGKEGILLDPKPRNFLDNERMRGLSPFAVFNTIRFGIEGTGMKPHQTLTDKEAWDLSFYVLGLRYSNKEKKTPTLTLEQIATLSDDELTSLIGNTPLSTIRTYEADSTSEKPIEKAKTLLNKARELCLVSDWQGADKLVTLAYLEGIEPYEFTLKKSKPELIPIIEKQISIIHDKLSIENGPEALAALKQLNSQLEEVESSITSQDYKPLFSAFMTMSILLREGLEALLVIIIFMNILSVTELEQWKKYVHFGWISAIIVGIFIWIGIGEIIKESKLRMELLEGVLTLSAVFLLVYVGFWLHKKSSIDQWKTYIKNKINTEAGNANFWGIFSLSFLVVFREIFESILFISTVDIQSRGEHRMYILLGCIVAFFFIIMLYLIFTRVSKNIPFKTIISFSIIVLSILAITLTGKGIHSLQEANLIKQTYLAIPSIDLLGIFSNWETLLGQLIMLILLVFLYKQSQTK